jgi:hypothetical protein
MESQSAGDAMDRRKYHRIATDQVISFAEIDHPDQLGVGLNLSPGGIQFNAIGCDIHHGDVLRVTFNVGEKTVVAIGRVAWATDTDPISMEVGIEFLEIDPAAMQMLDELEGIEF